MTIHSHHKYLQFGDEFYNNYNFLPTKIRQQSELQCCMTPLYDDPYSHGDHLLTKPTTVWPLGKWGDNTDNVATKGN